MNDKRDSSLDIFKGFLIIGMIFAHIIQFFSNWSFFLDYYISMYINIITFSGFMFSFGYVSQIAYLKKEFKDVYKNMLMGSLKALVASIYQEYFS